MYTLVRSFSYAFVSVTMGVLAAVVDGHIEKLVAQPVQTLPKITLNASIPYVQYECSEGVITAFHRDGSHFGSKRNGLPFVTGTRNFAYARLACLRARPLATEVEIEALNGTTFQITAGGDGERYVKLKTMAP